MDSSNKNFSERSTVFIRIGRKGDKFGGITRRSLIKGSTNGVTFNIESPISSQREKH